MSNLYMALGDSITAGYGVGAQNFACLFYSYLLSINPNLGFINYGINGLTTGRLVNLLSANDHLKNLVAQAEVITVTIGSNDLLVAAVSFLKGINTGISQILCNMDRNLSIIGSQIRLLNPQGLAEIATIYNPLPAGPYFQYSEPAQQIINQANKIIIFFAKRYGFKVIAVDKAFRGREQLVIGPDHLHPNILGHQIIAAGSEQATKYATSFLKWH